MTRTVLFLTEAGDGIGFGHYMRCSAILEYFKERGVTVHMVLKVKGNYKLPYSESIDWHKNRAAVLKYANKYNCLFIDSYLATEEDYSFFSVYFSKVIVMDDYQRLPYKRADLIINPNVYGSDLHYNNRKTQVAGGKDYVILRKVFRDSVTKLMPTFKIQKVLITLGGSDVRNLIPRLIEWASSFHLEMTVVAGNENYKNRLNEKYEKVCRSIIGFAEAETMLTLMNETDLCISASGQTLHELAFLGVPTIGICIGDDQIRNMKKYCELGFLKREIYWNSTSLDSELSKSFHFLESLEHREKVSRKGTSIINSQGVKNIFDKVFSLHDWTNLLRKDIEYQNLIAKNFTSLNEAEKIEVLRMRNHDEVRKWMIHSDLIPISSHLNFIDHLQTKNSNFYWLVEEVTTHEKLGVIYINKINSKEENCEFGIYANPFSEAKGKGSILANMELYIIFELAGLNSVSLEVQANNIRAIRLYEKLGFASAPSGSSDFFKMILYKKNYRGNKK